MWRILIVVCVVLAQHVQAFKKDHWWGEIKDVYKKHLHVFNADDPQHAPYMEYHMARSNPWIPSNSNHTYYRVQTIRGVEAHNSYFGLTVRDREMSDHVDENVTCTSTHDCKLVELDAWTRVEQNPRLSIRLFAIKPDIHKGRGVPTWQSIAVGDILVGANAPPEGPARTNWTLTFGYAHPLMRGVNYLLGTMFVALHPTYTVVTFLTGVLEPQNMFLWAPNTKPKVMMVYSTIIRPMYERGQLASQNILINGWVSRINSAGQPNGKRMSQDWPQQTLDECYLNGIYPGTPLLLSSRSNYINLTNWNACPGAILPPPLSNTTYFPPDPGNPNAPYERVYGFGNWSDQLLAMAKCGFTNIFDMQECMSTPMIDAMLQNQGIYLYSADYETPTVSGWRSASFVDTIMKYMWSWIKQAWINDGTQSMIKNWIHWPTRGTRSYCDVPTQVSVASTHYGGSDPNVVYVDSPGSVNSWQLWIWAVTTTNVTGNSTLSELANQEQMATDMMVMLNDYTWQPLIDYYVETGQIPPSLSCWEMPVFAEMRAEVPTWIQNKGQTEMFPFSQLPYQNQFEGLEGSIDPYVRNSSIVSDFFYDWLLTGVLNPSNFDNDTFVREMLMKARDNAADAFELIALPDCIYPDDITYSLASCDDGASPTAIAFPYWDPSHATISCQVTMVSAMSLMDYQNGTTIPCQEIPGQSVSGEILLAITTLVVLAQIGIFCLVIYFRKTKVIRSSYWEWSLILQAGCLMVTCTAFTNVGPRTNETCGTFMVLTAIGFTTILGSLNVKCLYIDRTFHQTQYKTIKASSVFPFFGVYIASSVVCLVAFFATTPNLVSYFLPTQWQLDGFTIAQCNYGNSNISIVWVVAQMLIVIFSTRLGWRSLNVPNEYSEYTTLMAMAGMATLFAVVALPLVSTTTTDVERSVLKTTLLLIWSVSVDILYFGPKFYYLWMGDSYVVGTRLTNGSPGETGNSNPHAVKTSQAMLSGKDVREVTRLNSNETKINQPTGDTQVAKRVWDPPRIV